MKTEIERHRKRAYQARQNRDWLRSIELFKKVLKALPDDAAVRMDLADSYMEIEAFDAAVSLYAELFQKDSKNPTNASNLGAALLRQGRIQEARVLLEHCLELDKKNIYALINLGGVYQAMGEPMAALNSALEAVSIDPTSALAFNNLGSAFSDLAKYHEAKHAFETALLLKPGQIDALINIAGCDAKLNDHQSSIKNYEKVLDLLPREAVQRAESVRFFSSFQYLQLGDLKTGWDYYEGGFSPLVPLAGARTPKRNFSTPLWDGSDLTGKSILLWREQGIGDEILFSSCIPDLLLQYPESSVYFECESRLQHIYSRSIKFLKILNQEQNPPKSFDYHLPIGSLMKFFRRDVTSFQGKGAFLSADRLLRENFKARLAPYSGRKIIGLYWRSGLISPTRNINYTAINDWTFLKNIKETYVFVNLQYGDCEEELIEVEKKWEIEIVRWKDVDLKNDMDHVFALVSNLDAVVTVGTSVSAISGSLGVPTIYLAKRGWLFLGQDKFPWFDNFYPLIPQEDEIVATQLSRVPEALEKVLAISSATVV